MKSDFGTCYGALDTLKVEVDALGSLVEKYGNSYKNSNEKALKKRKSGEWGKDVTGYGIQKKNSKEIQEKLKIVKGKYAAAQKACKGLVGTLSKGATLGFEGPVAIPDTIPKDKAWEYVQKCWERADLDKCRNGKCGRRAISSFKKCTQKITKKAKLKKGSSYKDLMKSINATANDAEFELRKCRTEAGRHEKQLLEDLGSPPTKAQGKKIGKKIMKFMTDCFEEVDDLLPRVMKSRIQVHFAD
ncbi:MAG: hypothetical protein GY705_27925 [Bacteroidetes bacterium]|nr:hypothetical protein [Bacteroidota bacterium]